MDYSALYHDYGVELMNVLDIQLVDVGSRQTRGEGQAAQFRRLQKYLPYINLHSNMEAYQQVHKLSGLSECVKEHNVTMSAAAYKTSGTVFRLLVALFHSNHCPIASGPYSLASSAPPPVLSELRGCRRRTYPRPLRQVHAVALHYPCPQISE